VFFPGGKFGGIPHLGGSSQLVHEVKITLMKLSHEVRPFGHFGRVPTIPRGFMIAMVAATTYVRHGMILQVAQLRKAAIRDTARCWK